MNISDLLPPLPEPGFNAAHPLANVYAYGFHANQMRAYAIEATVAALDEVLRMTVERIDKYETDMEGADGEDFSSAEWAAGAMRYHATTIRRLRDQLISEGK
jgi:hypothetical protein